MHKDRNFIILLVIILLFLNLYKEYYTSKYTLTTSYYEISTNQISSLRIVHLTDLHNSVFGTNNQDLIDLVNTQNPDLIFITGDLVNADSDDYSIAVHLIEQLSTIAPVYISYGNHEYEYENNYNIELTPLFEQAGAIVLEKEYVDITINNQNIRIGGIYGYCVPAKYLITNEADKDECAFLLDFQETDAYTILLCHMPVCWMLSDGINEWNIDCVMAGHVHGGQIILPFIGGLYAPDYGYFPGKLEGLYYSDDNSKVLVLSKGLGSTEIIPRMNNIPEVLVLDIK